MPLSVHAIVVTRHGATSAERVLRTLEALARQSRQADAVTLVVCGDDEAIRENAAVQTLVRKLVHLPATTRFAQALGEALPRSAPDAAVWILDDDCVPAPDALELLIAALERSPMAAIAAPKLRMPSSPPLIASYGVSMTRFGRSVELTAGQIDQGQHDGDREALAADARGMLVRGMDADHLVPDSALGSNDVGLDLGVRARLNGARVALTPRAHVQVTGVGPGAPPRRGGAGAYAERRAQLHRRLVYASPAWIAPHWLSLLPLALWRSIASLLAKTPGAILPEWRAAAVTAARLDLVATARTRIRAPRKAGWGAIAPLRVRRRDAEGAFSAASPAPSPQPSAELRFFAGGGAIAVFGAFLVGLIAFVPLLTWPVLGGGGLLPLRETVAGLWGDAAWGMRALGTDVVGPADPFAGVVAMLGSLTPWAPSSALVALWLLALPLALLGGWFAATRVTERASLRVTAGILWAVAPTFLTALTQPHPAAVILHLVLPWLVFAASAAHRTWGAAGAASLLLVAVIACAPSLAPAAAVLWLLALGIVLATRSFAPAARIAWLPVPLVAIFAPLFAWQYEKGNLIALLADPGLPWHGSQATADAAGRLLLASGFPSPDYAGWATLFGEHAGWAALLLAPLALVALLAPIAPRWRVGMTLFGVLALGAATAFFAPGVAVSFAQGTSVPLWPGSGLSLAWVGLVGGAILVAETVLPRSALRSAALAVVLGAALVCAVPALSSLARGDSALHDGPESTLPAYVAADARGDVHRATLVITPLGEAALAARAVWGTSDTLGAQSTIVSTATEPIGSDISALAVELISAREFDAASALSEQGIRYVLLAEGSQSAASLRAQAVVGLNQRADLVRVGDTEKGTLWRVDAEPLAPSLDSAQRATADRLGMLMLFVLGVTLLLALPTRATRQAARNVPRVVGGESG